MPVAFAVALVGCPKHEATRQDAAAVVVAAEAGTDADIVTHASEAYEAGAPGLSGGTVDGNALRTRHRARLAADHAPVAVLTGGTAEELGRRICEA